MDKKAIARATEDVLRELDLKAWEFHVKAVRAVPHGEISQIRLYDTIGHDKVAVVNYRIPKRPQAGDLTELKARLRQQLRTLNGL